MKVGRIFVVALLILNILAWIDFLTGNPGAINGIIGTYIGVGIFSAVAWIERQGY
jgi:hypothetical protein